MAWTPLSEYSSPVYMTGAHPAAPHSRRASQRMVPAGTPVIASTASGRKCWT